MQSRAPDPGVPSRLLSFSEACARAGIAVRTGRSWLYRASIHDPDLHVAGKTFAAITRKIGGRLKIDEADLNLWLAARRQPARAAPAGRGERRELLQQIADGLFALPPERREKAGRAVVALLELLAGTGEGEVL